MKTSLKVSFIGMLCVVSLTQANPPPGPYNQTYTYNQNMQYGVTNWMTAFGPGINTAGVAIVSGLVNAMTRPDPVVVVPSSRYASQPSSEPAPYAQNAYPNQPSNCRMQTLYDQSGNPRYVKVCD